MAKNKSKSKKGASAKKAGPTITIVSENRKARHRYEILDTIECGLMLMGSEVKSMREGKLSLDEAHIREKDRELWLIGADIAHYNNAGMWNHDPRRPRKLLLHAVEINKFSGRAHERGLTLIPLKVYFNERGIAKCLMGLVKGKKIHDKRETLKKRDSDRGLQRAMRGRG
ncbi:SsrA-binding protein SmpB [Rhodopirellula sp. MGV]|uniref:SsrA-binding protein SmpB n=1 Tax=Rhodopirellula sp. MGV TaxID=2023130 RepID=UPI000B97B5C1|nr:SsrA-binding protein SmpB [Rhodopirellula sp. MGV]OYP36039.1 SsrA-binding protein [Rhodopirellula sp. MGV]PNY36602.1 SsrA-binding protein SmpB [Rhodopirellula baltica]